MFYNDNYIISQSLFSPLPDVVESKKDQNWKILSRKNCFTAEIEAAVILRPPFKDKLQRKQTSKHCQWNNKLKDYGFYHGTKVTGTAASNSSQPAPIVGQRVVI